MTETLATRDRATWQQRARALPIEGRAFIDGKLTSALSGRSFDDISPIDGRMVAAVARCESADVDAAVAAARRGFERGRGDTPTRRTAGGCCSGSRN